MSIRPVAVALLVGSVVGTLAACSGSGKSGDPSGTQSADTQSSNSHVINVTISAAKGCTPDRSTLSAGGITVKVTNKDATAVSELEWLDGERIVGEKENIPPGFGGQFAVTVDAGTYQLYCPGATPQTTTVKVTGKSKSTGGTAVAALLKQATTGYAQYVNTQVAALVTTVAALDKTLQGTDLTAAQNAYMKARPYYEKIEPVAESFVIGNNSLDADIDVRIADTTFAKWTGFHRIEYGLFKDKSLKGLAPFGAGLVSNVAKLQNLTKNLTYKPVELANGAQGLLDEVASSKITGEEEAYSLIDLLDFANNDEGAEQAFAQLQPALDQIDKSLSTEIATNFTALDTLVESYRTTSNASGYVLYSDLTQTDKQKLAAAVKAVQEPLSQVASKIANA